MEHNIRNKIIIILSYLLIWALAIIVFWFFTSGSDAMGYSLMYLWIILPVTTFVESVLIGKNDFFGKGKWGFTLFFGLMYMLAEYGTFKMANNIDTNKINAPEWGDDCSRSDNLCHRYIAGFVVEEKTLNLRR